MSADTFLRIQRARLYATLFGVLLSCAGSVSAAEWVLDQQGSSVTFSSTKSTKNQNIVEGHRFRSLAGSISDTGSAVLTIDLHSVDTQIPIRDERMINMLFGQRHAIFRTELGSDFELKTQSKKVVSGSLNFNGIEKTISCNLSVQKVSENRVLVFSQRPIIIAADSFELHQGMEMLRAIAGLKSINGDVPVQLALLFCQGHCGTTSHIP